MCNHKNNISIIIPAYKTEFLPTVFECIKNQTSKDFNLYVFDDNSPYNIKEIFDLYFKNWDNATYKRFETNLGACNLTAHWQRCVENTLNEEWFWLFSDDDIMDMNCIELILETIKKENISGDVIHFNISQIDENDNITYIPNKYPSYLSIPDYYAGIVTDQLENRMPEFIFRRSKWNKIGGYIHFDLAWRSDNATVMAMTYPGYIYTIQDAQVQWRLSKNNITGKENSKEGIMRKINATIDFANWAFLFFVDNSLKIPVSKKQLYKYYLSNIWFPFYKAGIYDILKLSDKYIATQKFCNKFYFVSSWIYECFKVTKKTKWMYLIISIFRKYNQKEETR